MTSQEINEAIAKHLGWVLWENAANPDVQWAAPTGIKQTHDRFMREWKQIDWNESMRDQRIPNYVEDLNAMAAAETMLEANWYSYFQHLSAVCGNDGNDNVRLYSCITATAHQRAKSFCRALGLWKD